MALNDNVKNLMLAVARDNDLQKAKSYIKVLCANETAACNQQFCRRIESFLNTSALNMMELPPHMKGLVCKEDVSLLFNPNRYWVSERERKIIEKLLEIRTASSELRALGVNYLNATLLYGPSGTGKTEFGRYLAYQLELPFIYADLTSLIDSHLGATSQRIDKIFKYLGETKCVFMLDELDAIALARANNDGGAEKEMGRVTIALMQSLDRLGSDVILLASTNRYDLIDPAVKRRFPLHHEVKIFSPAEISTMLIAYLEDVNSKTNKPFKYDHADILQYANKYKPTQAEAINCCIRAMAKAVLTDRTLQIVEGI